jgi:deoxyribonuclease V
MQMLESCKIMASFQKLHDWNLSPSQAIALQGELRERVLLAPLDVDKIETVAGADVSFNKFSETIYAGIVVLKFPTLEVLETAGVVAETKFPYIPGLLSFREIPALLEAWAKLQTTPDILICDGQGIAHPRRMGIASHAGLLIGKPTLGCAKSVLVGKFEELEKARGNWQPMIHKSATVGAALRTKNNVQPVYVSPGHLIDLESSIEVLLRCDGGYRIPEPTRRAHLFVNELRIHS